jgi:GTP-binding protein
MFVDFAKVLIKSGDGGKGCVSFHREKYKPRGGPDGGDGGDGGSVFLLGDAGMNSLVRFRYTPRLIAGNGEAGMGSNRSGRKGDDLIVPVPCGTVLRREETGQVIAEIEQAEQQALIARGGRGGKGNQHFATPTHRAPRYAQSGLPGTEFHAVLELKIIADIGLVGLPNAGKSSLITAVSGAAPKVAGYPFTTLNPVVGVVELPGYRSMVMADIPGIIEGASHGRGLGIQFLKHVERTKILLFVLDISEYADVEPVRAFQVLQDEIRRFGHNLETKKYLIAANKIDIDPEGKHTRAFIQQLDTAYADRVFPVSAVTREGIDSLVSALDRCIAGDTAHFKAL